jgi:two-component system, OmpR family, phosphate regulon sensor histidine kinase PhoR
VKAPRILRYTVRVIASVAFLAASLTVAFHVTSYLYLHLGWRPPFLVAQLVNTVLGLCLMVFVVVIFGVLSGSRRAGPFAPIIDALERIAKGDFSTRVDGRYPVRGAVGELTQTVNSLALKLDQMEKMRQEFISNVSHEIQSPLTSIRGFACALQQEGLSAEDRRHYLEIIEAESLRLSKLSANLLRLTSLESDQMKFDPKPYRLDAQIRALILACEPQWTAKRLEMDVSLEEAEIPADEDLMSQVWLNLIHNSIKFTPEGGSVRVALHRRGDRIEVSVADTGIGISHDDQAHVFERFYKADPARQRSDGGSGLGLSIAKKVLDLHGARISVRSELGAGASFIVELPLNGVRLN